MRSMSLLQMVGGVAVAGAVAAGSTAFTGTGLGVTGNAASAQFVGGQVSQSVSGAVLSDVQYGFSDGPANTAVNLVTLTFTGATADGLHVAVAFTGGTGGAFTCEDIGHTTTHISTCTPSAADRVGLTSLAVTVS